MRLKRQGSNENASSNATRHRWGNDLKTNPKHREQNLTKLAEELERLELIYHPSIPQLNNIRQSERDEESSLSELVREEIALALAKKNEKTTQQEDDDKSSQVGFLAIHRENQNTHQGGTTQEIKDVSIVSQKNISGKTVLLEISANVPGRPGIRHPYVL